METTTEEDLETKEVLDVETTKPLFLEISKNPIEGLNNVKKAIVKSVKEEGQSAIDVLITMNQMESVLFGKDNSVRKQVMSNALDEFEREKDGKMNNFTRGNYRIEKSVVNAKWDFSADPIWQDKSDKIKEYQAQIQEVYNCYILPMQKALEPLQEDLKQWEEYLKVVSRQTPPKPTQVNPETGEEYTLVGGIYTAEEIVKLVELKPKK